MQYLSNSPQSRTQMLETIGRSKIEDLFSQIPKSVRLGRALDLPGPLSEKEILDFFQDAAHQSGKSYTSFLGGGAYQHHRPAAVNSLLSRGEFFTAYTPYQAEISQGTLQAIFEFQSLICLLTGMEVSNASLYDGSTAMTEAVLMALRITRRHRVLMARSVHPEYQQVLNTYLRNLKTDVAVASFSASGEVDLEQLESDLTSEPAAVVIQSPNFFGVLEDCDRIAKLVHDYGALLIVNITEPLSLAITKPPVDADIICGEGQSFGVPLAFGGPYLGFLTTRQKYLRQMPGRLVGQTCDTKGRTGYVITLASREQHIRREKATSNICTNQSLCALTATIYLCLLGKHGIRKLAEHNLSKAHYTLNSLIRVPGVTRPFSGKIFNEFVIQLPGNPQPVLKELQQGKILGGLPLANFYPELSNGLLVCATETVSKNAIDHMGTIYKKALADGPTFQPTVAQ